jgi:proteasome lid subunit RPN8/RPN11
MAKATPQSLLFTAQAYDAMIAHCVKGSALACCGILAGIPPTASVAYPLRNVANSPTRYIADWRDISRATKDLEGRGLEFVAIYHSRPETAAVPSPTDLRENAYGDLPRVIVAIGEFPSIRVWRLTKTYCEELTWRLQPREGGPTPEGDGGDDMQHEGARGVADQASPPFPSSALSWLFRRRRTSVRIPIRRLQDRPSLEPELMWDPALDCPPDRGIPSG